MDASPRVCRILAIETSCDETAAAIVEDGRMVKSSVVSSQVDLHARFGGVVPELAGRAHIDLLTPVVAEAMELADATGADLDAVAATIGPGLIGSLLVGVSAAKAYALAWGIPFVGVNHLEGHLHSVFLEDPDMALPAVVLLVSGGQLHHADPHAAAPAATGCSGQTIDDAAGEAFDKRAARPWAWAMPGRAGDRPVGVVEGDGLKAIAFHGGLRREGCYDFSFFQWCEDSRSCHPRPQAPRTRRRPTSAASFQEAVVDVISVEKTMRAAASTPWVRGRSASAAGWRPTRRPAGADRQRRLPGRGADGVHSQPGPCAPTTPPCVGRRTAWLVPAEDLDGPTPLDAAADPNPCD